MAAAYHPAGEGVEVGGDFYDVFPIGRDDWVVVIGDVCGKGVDAAVVTALVRHTVRALAVAHDEPRHMLADLNEVLLQHETERFCTVALMRLRRDADGWYAVLSVGGHPSPLLLRGDAAPAAVRRHRPVDRRHRRRGRSSRAPSACSPGDVLVLYTDGVPDGRRDGEVYGERADAGLAGAHGADAASVVEGLVADVVDFQRGVPRDDIAVLAVGVPRRLIGVPQRRVGRPGGHGDGAGRARRGPRAPAPGSSRARYPTTPTAGREAFARCGRGGSRPRRPPGRARRPGRAAR